MENKEEHTTHTAADIEELKNQLYEATSIIEAIKQGAVDALVLNTNGRPDLYSLETADYTYRVLIEKIGEGALSISNNGIILYCNEYFSKLINVPTSNITGTYFDTYVDNPSQFLELKDKLGSGLSKGEICLSVNGKKIPVYVSLTNLKPMIPAIGIIVTDLTEKRKHEETLELHQKNLESKVGELYQTNNHLEQFIHVISHDIKEPVRKILTYASHLIDHKDKESKFNNVKIIHNAALRLNSLVDDLVNYSLATTKIDAVNVDINNILEEVTDDLELIINESNAKIIIDELPTIQGSPVQMRQLFSNILTNALKYKKAGIIPEVRITLQTDNYTSPEFPGRFYKISVSDNGIGMNKEHLQKIFIIFQRLHMPDEYSGNGIGLAICKKIMENHSGKIEAESTQGEGSSFNLYFPYT